MSLNIQKQQLHHIHLIVRVFHHVLHLEICVSIALLKCMDQKYNGFNIEFVCRSQTIMTFLIILDTNQAMVHVHYIWPAL